MTGIAAASGVKSPFQAVTHTYTTAGSTTETIPPGATSCKIRVWGGGGAGGRDSVVGPGGGGGGGACLRTITIQPSDWNQTINYTVGAGPAGRSTNGTGTSGGQSSVTSSGLSFTNLNMLANGGGGGGTADTVGAGGTASGGTTNNTGVSGQDSGASSLGGNSATLETIFGAGGTGAGDNPGGAGQGVTSGTSGAGASGRVDFLWT